MALAAGSQLSKSQVDKLGALLRSGSIDADVITRLDCFRREFSDAYQFVERTLTEHLGQSVTGRPSKSTIALCEKLRRETSRLSQIQDVAGCRVVVGNLYDQDELCSNAKILLGRVEVDDRRLKPSHGYRAVHLIVERGRYLVEVQIRTRPQHAWAEISEKIADAFGHEIKYGQGDGEAIEFLHRLSELSFELENIDYDKFKLSRGTTRLRAVRSEEALAARLRMKALSRRRVECVRNIRSLLKGQGN
ncbi:MAG: hypothetical protein DCF27_01360 [Lysobacteraceae bacterium]|nr:MAG: hypothetical protein DCF27_01360 [Xanthomonadaceae bacterium]